MNDNSLIAEIEGYAARYGEADLNGDIIEPGAFAKSLARRRAPVRMLYQHASETPIGRWNKFRESRDGLIASGEIILSSPKAREIYALLKGGALDGLSIGYQTVRSQKRSGKSRRILQADLWEVSIVTFPMAVSARLTHIGEPKSDQNFQNPLRASFPKARPARRALVSSPPSARHFADALQEAASIISL